MALRGQPYFPLYVQDFMTDERLNECGAESVGVYIRLMCVMHKSQEYGTFLLKQKDKQDKNNVVNFAHKLFKHMPYHVDVIQRALQELIDEEVLTIDGDLLFQKRMVKDGKLSDTRASAGKKGGKQTQKNINDGVFAEAKVKASDKAEVEAKTKQNTEDEYEDEYEDTTTTTTNIVIKDTGVVGGKKDPFELTKEEVKHHRELVDRLDAKATSYGLPFTVGDIERCLRWAGEYTEDWLLEAIERCSLREKRSWGMVHGILKSWKSKGGIDYTGQKALSQNNKEPVTWD